MYYIYFSTFIFCSLLTKYTHRRITYNIIAHAPLLIVYTLYHFLGEGYGFVKLNDDVAIVYTIFILLGFLSEGAVLSIKKGAGIVNTKELKVSPFFAYFCLALVCIVLMHIRELSLMYGVSSDIFEQKMSGGFIGHSLVFLMASLPFLYLLYKDGSVSKYTLFIVISLIFLSLFLKQVKSWVMIPMVFLLFIFLSFSDDSGGRKRFIYSFLVLVFSALLFFLVYFFKKINSDSGTDVDFLETFHDILKHFLFYLFSGVGAFSEGINNGLDKTVGWYLPFMPIVHSIEKILGNDLTPAVSNAGFIINASYPRLSNVFTMFGTLWVNMGYMSFVYYSIVVALLTVLSIRRESVIMSFIYLFFASFAVFSWFDFYYFHLTVYEVPIFMIFIYFIFKSRKVNRIA